ncbi:hypothetical protein RGI145_19570 [Roseomonas gilardii]|uniref:Antirepressor protein C-terminal domain-containing protein n=1 Tax=Roseomonas gilardii TaxID=257708 RepID=A0A1L7ALA8_9PROT|nr:phage regulatory protein/antirepressor Ant [Roseomonas gilardii]APT59547.1 hypothetical protein RGI145_19570 [Roseomonas gilardii]
MIEQNIVQPTVDGQKKTALEPKVTVKDGRIWADSRDVASFFGREHKNVLRDIRGLHCSPEFHRLNFAPFKINDLTGESTSHYEMTKSGFAFLVMGFTGREAGRFKEAYIARFDEMEAELRDRGPADIAAMLNDPMALRSMLIGYSERVMTLEAQVAADKPKTVFYDRFANADGLYGIQNASRALGLPPNKLSSLLKQGYLFYQGGNLVAKAVYREQGLFEMKNSLDDQGKTRFQTFVTPKGLLYFARKFGLTVQPKAEELN